MSEPDPNQVLNINGPIRKTLFWFPLEQVLTGKESELQHWADEQWKHYTKLTDDRLVAVVAAQCIENAIDELLTAIAPGHKPASGRPDISHYQKIRMTKSLRLVPERILDCCEFVKNIRNQFAHNVHCQRLEDLAPKYTRELVPHLRRFTSNTGDRQEAQRLFKTLVSFTLIALRVYAEHVRKLRDYIESGAGRKNFKYWCETRS